MIPRTVEDAAQEIVWYWLRSQDEVKVVRGPLVAAGIVPPMAVVVVETVEFRRFRITVTEEQE